jgi:hypothetical protein
VTALVTGATNDTFITPPLTVSKTYFVRVSNSLGSVDSTTATVTVLPTAPVITTQPVNKTIGYGKTATLTVAAAGSSLSYQWYQGNTGNTATPVGTNTRSFVTPPLTTSTSYWVRVSNGGGSADSTTATVTVNPAVPVITTQPKNQTITTGQTATLTVVATGTGLNYQWYKGLTGDVSTPVGTNSSSFTTPTLTTTTSYWVKVSNAGGSRNSATATVTVGNIAISTQPASQTISSGQTATLSVVASGTGLNYQWYQGNRGVQTTPVGTNSSSFTTPVLTATTTYWVKVSNSAGFLNSNAATVTVTP